jgi:hypothetical protein
MLQLSISNVSYTQCILCMQHYSQAYTLHFKCICKPQVCPLWPTLHTAHMYYFERFHELLNDLCTVCCYMVVVLILHTCILLYTSVHMYSMHSTIRCILYYYTTHTITLYIRILFRAQCMSTWCLFIYLHSTDLTQCVITTTTTIHISDAVNSSSKGCSCWTSVN